MQIYPNGRQAPVSHSETARFKNYTYPGNTSAKNIQQKMLFQRSIQPHSFPKIRIPHGFCLS